MGRGINKVILIGNVGREPETRYGSSGGAICNFNVATTEAWKNKDTGEKEEKTEWHRIVTFRRLAEICGEYLHKGSKVYIEGKLQTREWEKDGIKRYTTEIVANEMQMLDSRSVDDSALTHDASATAYKKKKPPPPPDGQPQGAHNSNDPFQDDIPF